MLSTEKLVNRKNFDEGFPCDDPVLARLSYVNMTTQKIEFCIKSFFNKCEQIS